MPKSPSAYASGHFELNIDGHKTTSFLKAVEGGNPKQGVVSEATGSELTQMKHGGVWEIDPITIDFGMSGAKEILKWIQGSWRKDWSTRNGEIIHADFDLKATFVQEFSDAVILETTFPTLDGSSREGAYMKVKFQPQNVLLKKENGARTSGIMSAKQKMWLCSQFALHLDGIEGLEHINKIDSFTIKQNVKKFYSGDPDEKFPQLIPTKLEFPNLVCYMAEGHAHKVLNWFNSNKGAKDMERKQQLQSGALEFNAPDGRVVFRINLYEVGLANYQVVSANANEDKIKRVKFELFVGRMDIDGDGALGLA